MGLAGILVFLLGLQQQATEARPILDPSHHIDEIKLRVNHYFKRKETICSGLGRLVLGCGTARLLLTAWMFARGECASAVALVDLLCVINLAGITLVSLLIKFAMQKGQQHCPRRLMQCKARVARGLRARR